MPCSRRTWRRRARRRGPPSPGETCWRSSPLDFWRAIGQHATAYAGLTMTSALHNIVVATVGNLVGGSLMIGAVCWFVHLRKRDIN